jgi:hypothetical protein
VDLGARRERAIHEIEVEVANPVEDVAAAADREDDFAPGIVDGDVSGNASPEPTISSVLEVVPLWSCSVTTGSLLKSAENGGPVALNGRAVAATGDGRPSRGVRVAVRRTRVLGVEGKVVHVLLTNGLCRRRSALVCVSGAVVGYLTASNVLQGTGVVLDGPDGAGHRQGNKREKAQGQHLEHLILTR